MSTKEKFIVEKEIKEESKKAKKKSKEAKGDTKGVQSKESSAIAVGSFQNYFTGTGKSREDLPQLYIFASSQRLETQGGISRRLLAGRGTDGTAKIKDEVPSDSTTRLFFRSNGPSY